MSCEKKFVNFLGFLGFLGYMHVCLPVLLIKSALGKKKINERQRNKLR